MYKGTPNPPVKPSAVRTAPPYLYLPGRLPLVTTGSKTPAGRLELRRRRRRWALFVVVAVLSGSLLLTALSVRTDSALSNPAAITSPRPASALPADLLTAGWTTFHGSENRSGYTLATGPTNSRILWEHALGAFPIRNGAVVSGSTLVVTDLLGGVAELNASAGGAAEWTASVGTAPTTPDLAPNDVFIGDSRGVISDLLRTNGSARWTASVNGGVVQGLAVENRMVVVGTSHGVVVALNESNGAALWSLTMPGHIAGALAFDAGRFYAVTTAGEVVQVFSNGTLGWSASVNAAVDSGVSVWGRSVYVADQSGNLSALSASNGSLEWRFHDPIPADGFESTPAVGPALLVASSDRGGIFGLDPLTGSLRWNQTVQFSGYAAISSPALTAGGVYLVDASETVSERNLSTGNVIWQTEVGSDASFSSPAVFGGQLILGNEVGYVIDFATAASIVKHEVAGTVTNRTGQGIAGGLVDAGIDSGPTASDGSFAVFLPNGSYVLNATAPGYLPTLLPVNVSGPVVGLHIVLRPVPVFLITGVVRNAVTDHPLAAANITLFGEFGYLTSARSGPDGAFSVNAPNGSNYVTVDPLPGYNGLQMHVEVRGGLLAPLFLGLEPLGVSVSSNDPYRLVVVLGVVAVAAGAVAAGLGWRSRRLSEAALTPSVLTPFERFVGMRLLLIPGQIVAVLTLLYVFGTFLPAAALDVNPCTLAVGTCTSASWSNPASIFVIFWGGYVTFLGNLFTGQWGFASYGGFKAPAADFLVWWGPYTLELGVIALVIALAIGYPLGLIAGWKPDRPVDVGTRVGSITALLLPTFLVVLLLLGALYVPFLKNVGDVPYGILPSGFWYGVHGGLPSWIGVFGNTQPTGFPLIDGALHADWYWVAVVFSKTLLQALIIAIVYVAIFLRFARNAVAEATAEPHIIAARARGVPERRLLWGHTGRRVLPIFVLVFGLTIPIFLGTLILVEAMFNDPGLGTLLLIEMTNVTVAKFGFAGLAAAHPGNMYQVMVFLVLLIVLFASLAADILARLLDPRLTIGEAA